MPLDPLAPNKGLDASQPVVGLGPFDPDPNAPGPFDPDPNAPGPVKRGFGAGVSSVKANLGGAVALGAHGIGATGVEKSALDYAAEQSAAASEQTGDVGDITKTDWTSPKSISEHFRFLLGNAIPSLALMFAGGVAGRGLGAVAGRFAPKAAAALTEAGTLAGAVAPDVALESGGIYTSALDEKTENPAIRAAVGGAAAASLDFIPLLAAERYLKAAGKVGGFGAVLKGAAKGAPVGAALEGTQELGQAIIERAAAGKDLVGPDAVSDYLNSFAGGGLPGLFFGAGIGAAHARAKPVASSGQTPSTAPSISPVDEIPKLGTDVPKLGTPLSEADQQDLAHAQLATAHETAVGQVASLEPQLAQTQAAIDTAGERLKALKAEEKLPAGDRRPKNEIIAERKGVSAETKTHLAALEEIGGQLNTAREAVKQLAPQLRAMDEAAVQRDTSEKSAAIDATTPVETPKAEPIVDPNAAKVAEAAQIDRAVQQVNERFTVPAEAIPPTVRDDFAKLITARETDTPNGTAKLLDKMATRHAEVVEQIKGLPISAARAVAEKAARGESRLNAEGKQHFVDTALAPMQAETARVDAEQRQALGLDTKYSKGAQAVEPHQVVKDDEGARNSHTAFFGKNDDASLTFIPKRGKNPPRLLSIRSEESQGVRGRDMVAWLARTHGPAVVEDAVPRAQGFWEKMQAEGLIKSWSPLSFDSNAALTQDAFEALPEHGQQRVIDEYNGIMARKGRELTDHLRQLIGEDHGLTVTTFRAKPGDPIGSYTRIDSLKSLITLALNAKQELSVGDHEGFHYAEDRLLSGGERGVIRSALAPGRPLFEKLMESVRRYDAENQTHIADEVAASPAEAHAYAFELWRRGEFQIAETHGMLNRVFEKIAAVLRAIVRHVTGAGFTTMEDIFTALDRGQYAERARSLDPVVGPVTYANAFASPDGAPVMSKDGVAPWYRSALTDQVAALPMKSGTAQAWQEQVKGLVAAGKVKQAEIDAVGLEEFLGLERAGKITRDEVTSFLREHGVRVEEVVLGGPKGSVEWTEAMSIELDALEEARQRTGALEGAEEARRRELVDAEIDATPAGEIQPQFEGQGTKYSDLQLPGGTQYRELLLSLPDSGTPRAYGQDPGTQFTASHFDEHGKNLLAHVRFNERVDAEGQRVLFLEELQSDWAQQGREKGFNRTTVMPDNTTRTATSGIAPAPFVTSTPAWTGLILKRMIRYASEHGHDKIAWTTGAQQVERYTSVLRKHVDAIEWTKTKDGVQLVGYKDRGKDMHKVVDTTEKESALSDAIGKAMADRIRSDPAQSGMIEGENIRIDDTGMAAFYDRIVPNIANEVLRKLGGGKVGDVSIPMHSAEFGKSGEPAKQPGFTVTPEMVRRATDGIPLFSRAAVDDSPDGLQRVYTPQYSRAAVAAQSDMARREAEGDLVQQQMFQSFAHMQEGAAEHGSDQLMKVAYGALKTQVAGGLSRWWQKNIATPNFVAHLSKAYENVYRTLNTFVDYRNSVVTRMLTQKIPQWYKASAVDQKAAFAALNKRNVEGYTKDSPEWQALHAGLSDPQKELVRSANQMMEDFLRADLAADDALFKRVYITPGLYEKEIAARRAQVEQLIDRGYIPLRRYGDHTVHVYAEAVKPDGTPYKEVAGLSFFGTAAAAHANAKVWEEEIARTGAKLQVEVGTHYKAERDSTISAHQFLDTARRNGIPLTAMEQEQIVRALTSANALARNRMLERTGMPGYSEDGLRILNEFGMRTASKIAYEKFAGAIEAANAGRAVQADLNPRTGEAAIQIDQDRAQGESVEDFKARSLWKREGTMSGFHRNLAGELTDYVLVPDHTGGWSRKLRGAAMSYFIGGSLSGALVNTTSVPMMVVPELSIHTNYMNAASTTLQAWGTTWRYQHILRDVEKLKSSDPQYAIPGIDAPLRQALVDAAQYTLDTELHQIMGISQGQLFSQSQKVQRAVKAWMAPFQVSEQTNRISTFIAAYRVATTGDGVKQADGSYKRLSGPALFNFAREMINATQNNYNECVDTETEFLTVAGWKRFDEVSAGDRAYGVDGEGQLVDTGVKAVNVFPGPQRVLSFANGNGFEMVLTEKHDALVQSYNSRDRKWQRLKKRRAAELKQSDHVLRVPLGAAVERAQVHSDDFVRLLAWVAAEGSYGKLKTPGQIGDVKISQSQSHNPKHVHEIEQILIRLGARYRRYDNPCKVHASGRPNNMVTFTLQSPMSAVVRTALPDKALTTTLVNTLTIPQMRLFVDTFVKGDGHAPALGGATITQKSKSTVDLLQMMTVLSGRASTIAKVVAPKDAWGGDYHTLYINKETKRSHVKALVATAGVVDTVWCPTTECGTWIARRNGRVFVTGNSNRPGAARNPVFALMMMFKSFPLFMTEAAVLMARANPKSAVYMLLGLTAMTGVQGLPFAEAVEDVIDTVSQQLFNSPFNVRRAMRNTIKSASDALVGYDLSELVLRGGINSVLGVSASSRIGAGDFVPGSRLGTADANQGKILESFLGAPYAMVHDAAASAGKLVGGVFTGDWKDTADALRAGGPIAVRNLIKGAEQLRDGYSSDSHGKRGVDVNGFEAMLQMAGVSSAKLAKAYEFEKINTQTKMFYNQVSADMQQSLVRAMKDNDTAKVQAISDFRAKWNAQYPGMKLMANPRATVRDLTLSGLPMDQRSLRLWARRIRGENMFNEVQ